MGKQEGREQRGMLRVPTYFHLTLSICLLVVQFGFAEEQEDEEGLEAV